jgi:hypothetical protein
MTRNHLPKLHPSALLLALVSSTAVLSACRPASATLDEAYYDLSSPNPRARRKAADDIRALTDDAPPEQAAPRLLAALERETNPKAFGSMLIALGATGVDQAEPIIERYVGAPGSMGRWAARAERKWLEAREARGVAVWHRPERRAEDRSIAGR